MTSAIYAIVNQDTCDMYVGSSVALKRRWSAHRRSLENHSHYNTHLQRAYDKYGAEKFDWEIVESVNDKTNLIAKEQFWIDFFKPAYNGRPTANSPLGTKPSAETRAKMSASAKKRGFSATHRQNISKAKKGLVISDKQKEQIRATLTGRKLSAEVRAKISLAGIGRRQTDETKQKISAANKARWAVRKGALNG
jgi:group I intron endonuclease